MIHRIEATRSARLMRRKDSIVCTINVVEQFLVVIIQELLKSYLMLALLEFTRVVERIQSHRELRTVSVQILRPLSHRLSSKIVSEGRNFTLSTEFQRRFTLAHLAGAMTNRFLRLSRRY